MPILNLNMIQSLSQYSDDDIAALFCRMLLAGDGDATMKTFKAIQQHRPGLDQLLLGSMAGFTTAAKATTLHLEFLAGDNGELGFALHALWEKLGVVLYDEAKIATAIFELIPSPQALTGKALWNELTRLYPGIPGENLNIDDLEFAVRSLLEVEEDVEDFETEGEPVPTA